MEAQAQKMQELSSSVIRVENADEIVAFARKTLKNADAGASELATALAIATGRRMIEIFQKGQFCEIPGQRYEVRFTGQAKAGLQEVASITHNKPLEYSIPVLAPAGNVIRGVARVRGLCRSTTMDAKRINSNFCGRLNAFVKSEIHPELGFHDLRTFYALCSFEAFKPHTYSINGWIGKNLGHSGLNMSTSYTRMQVYGINKVRRQTREAAEDF
jgi:integrase